MIAKFWLNKYNHLDCIIYWTVEKPGTFPYFFGRTDDECIDRVKRAALSPQRLSHKNGNHMWIQYRGIFFEFGVGKSRDAHVSSSPYGHGECASQIESLPAGYSILSVECLEKCAKNYSKRFGLSMTCTGVSTLSLTWCHVSYVYHRALNGALHNYRYHWRNTVQDPTTWNGYGFVKNSTIKKEILKMKSFCSFSTIKRKLKGKNNPK